MYFRDFEDFLGEEGQKNFRRGVLENFLRGNFSKNRFLLHFYVEIFRKVHFLAKIFFEKSNFWPKIYDKLL